MPKVLEFPTAEGDSLLVAISVPGDDVEAVLRIRDFADKAAERVERGLEDVLRSVSGVAKSFHAALAGAPVESATLELGLQFTGKGRLYVVETEAQAAVKVSLTVRPPRT